MTKTAQEILAEWADPETGGTMPKDVRDAALAVLAEVARLTNKLNADSQNFEIECLKAKLVEAEMKRKGCEADLRAADAAGSRLKAKLAEVSAERDRQRGAAEKYYAESERLRAVANDYHDAVERRREELDEAGQQIERLQKALTEAHAKVRQLEDKYEPSPWRNALRGEPRLSTEEEAKAVMGAGQPLVKMREVGK